MLNALAYCRVSTDEQAADGRHSLPAQRRLCAEKAGELGFTLVATFEDPGRSGRSMNRRGLKDLLLRCQEDSSIRALFVQDTDRLARNTQDHLTIRAMLAKRGIKLVSVSQPMLEESAEGNMIDTILASVNQFQSELTARKVLKGMEQKVRSGWWPSMAPLGYRNVWQDPAGDRRTIEPDPEATPLVQEAFRLYATGRFALSQLCRRLHERGLRARRGARLTPPRLHGILRNPFYYGWIRWRGIELQGKHAPLVSRSLFDTAGEVLGRHNRGGSKEWKHRFLLRGFLRCEKCGRRLVGEYHAKKRRGYYRCHKPGGCSPGIAFTDIERQISDRVRGLVFSERFAEALIEKLKHRHEAERGEIERKHQGLVNRKSGLEARRNRAEEKLLTGVLTDDAFMRRRSDLESQLLTVNEEMAGLRTARSGTTDILAEVVRFVRDLPRAYEAAAKELKRLYLGFFWQGFTVRDGRIVEATPTVFCEALMASREIGMGPPDTPSPQQQSPEKVAPRSLVRTSGLYWTKRFDVRPLLALLEDPRQRETLRAQWETIKDASRSAGTTVPSLSGVKTSQTARRPIRAHSPPDASASARPSA